jgi:hypothetical protein
MKDSSVRGEAQLGQMPLLGQQCLRMSSAGPAWREPAGDDVTGRGDKSAWRRWAVLAMDALVIRQLAVSGVTDWLALSAYAPTSPECDERR